ncbi:hypothetical protein Rsub_11530 [Raphidocelis subcapitata]|uniref:EGF-like domain-containing protein n=1 Tax=Raphidocelis subcapitata TaxID=307507 RepID=A0A2V0PIN9_9CHLO|nr:hypothetical protein Rsub_11530 [Raphidocelis subcapitata]|eukprot:GBF98892.1 hypothetical protein Rsub_11530 [Raphidocelis subcapitata]
MARGSVFLLVSAALVAAVSGADIPEWASPGRSLLARQQCDFPISVSSSITSYNLTFKGTLNAGTRACWTVGVNNNCTQGANRCCLKGALKTPILKRLIVYPPSGSTCAQKTTRKFVTYNVAGGRFRKTKVDGVRVLIPLNKLKRVGGEVCVDFSAASGIPGCNAFDKLCSSSGCRALLWTRKFKRQAGEKKNFCCVSLDSNSGGGSFCSPGFYPDSSGSCAVCGIGFYCPNGADRIPCGPGKTTTTTTATDAAQCVPTCTRDADCGTGAACVGGTCSACKPGYYPSATAASGCAECGFGFYCPNGKDRNPCSAGKTTTTTTATDAAQCVPTCTSNADCPSGVACAGGTCSACKPGYYPSATAASGCAECGFGFYCPNGADRNPCGAGKTTTTTTATDAAQCVPTCTSNTDCPSGVACVGGTCSACKPGYYPSATAASGCAECGLGFYCPNGKDRNPCGAGKTTTTTTATDPAQCVPTCTSNTDCGTGVACVDGTCSACKPGYYPSATAASGCAECGFGFYCPNGADRNPCGAGKNTTTTTATDAAQCVPTCTSNTDCPSGVACVGGTCSACKPGYYPSATAASGCAECGFGFYCPNGADRNPCGAGKTTTTTTATDAAQCVPGCSTDADCGTGVACAGGTCSACKPGYYPSATAASGCAECGLGFYCPNGADRNPCGAGKNTTTTTATDAAQCVPTCTSNTDCPSGVACAGGTCSACKPGYYPSATAASGCAECGFGFYCPNGADRNPCGAGKNTTTTIATDAAQCVPTCTSNTDCPSGVACVGGTCSACKPGYYPSATAASGCAECGFGFYCPNGADRNPCGAGKTTTTTTATDAAQCVPTCTSNTDCPSGVACVGGTCSACKPGYYPSATAASGCAECGFGFYCPNGADRNPCGAGKTTATTTATDAAQCVPTCTSNTDCPSGVACVGGTCSACKPGYYPSATAASGCAECGFGFYCPNGKDRNPCGAGTTTATTTATAPTECLPSCRSDADCPPGVACVGGSCSACKPGYYPSATAAGGCAQCGFGFYCPNGVDRKPCGAGTTTATTTAIAPTECLPSCRSDADCPSGVACAGGTCGGCKPGYYPSATAASGCAECGFSYYCPNGKDRNFCGVGQTTATTTSTSASDCKPGCKTDTDCNAPDLCNTFDGTCANCVQRNTYIYGIDKDGIVYEANTNVGASGYKPVFDTGLGTGIYPATAYDPDRQQLLFLTSSRDLYYWQRGAAAVTKIASASQIGINISPVSNFAYYDNALWFANETAAVFISTPLVKVPLTYASSGLPAAGTPQAWTLDFVDDNDAPVFVPDSFGDIAINNAGKIYFNTIKLPLDSVFPPGAYFYSLPISTLGAPGSKVKVKLISFTAEPLQISFNCDGTTLWGQRWDTCEWFTINTATGEATKKFSTGLTQCLRDLGGAACTCAASV